eukprot:403060-Pyramimonas_sp.AAC.1
MSNSPRLRGAHTGICYGRYNGGNGMGRKVFGIRVGMGNYGGGGGGGRRKIGALSDDPTQDIFWPAAGG